MLSRLRLLLPNDNWCRALLAPVIVFVATAMDRHYLTDFWHHLSRGRAMVEHGGIVNKDLFTFTVPDESFQDNNWLTQLLYYWLYEHGGLDLVVFVNSLVLAMVFGVLVWLCRRAGGASLLASCLGILAFLGMWQVLIVRPQTFSFLLFLVLYAVLLAADRRRWLLVFPPLILALWSNVHGGFPIGLVLIGAFLLAQAVETWLQVGKAVIHDRHVRALAICLACSFLATFVNPYGWSIYRYVLTTSSTAAERRIDEWVPPGTHLFIGKIFVLSLIALIAVFGLARRRPSIRDVCLVVCFLPLALGSVRMVAWWVLISTPIMAAHLANVQFAISTVQRGSPASARRGSPDPAAPPPEGLLGPTAYCSILLGVTVLSLPWLEHINPLSAVRGTHRDEMDLEEVVRDMPGDSHRIFSRLEWGEYLAWRTAPQNRVFIDGRIEIYPDSVWADYIALTSAAAFWQSILERYGVDYLVLDTTYHESLIAQVRQSAEWRQVNEVGKAVVFERVAAAIAASRDAESSERSAAP